MENYEALTDELTRLNTQRQEIMKQMYEIETKLDKIKKEKATALFNEILKRISELEHLDYRIDAAVWNSECGDYDWEELGNNSGNYRLRHKDEIVVS